MATTKSFLIQQRKGIASLAVLFAVTIACLAYLQNTLLSSKAQVIAYGELYAATRYSSAMVSSLNRLQLQVSTLGDSNAATSEQIRDTFARLQFSYERLQHSPVTAIAITEKSELRVAMHDLAAFISSLDIKLYQLDEQRTNTDMLRSISSHTQSASVLADQVIDIGSRYWQERLPAIEATLHKLAILCYVLGGLWLIGVLAIGYGFFLMRRRVEDANASLQESRKATEEARRAVMAKNNFLAMIGHELRTPAQTIQSSIQFLDLRRADAKYREAMERLKSAARQSEALMRDLTDFARLESGKMPLREIPFNPSDVLKRLVSNYQPSANHKGLTIAGEYKNTRVSIVSDEYRFQQIATNLVTNAIKYSDKGTISVKLSYPVGEKTVLRLIVEDCGPGIRKEYLDTIFEPFSQDDQSNTRKHDGAGMGLAIVSGLVKLMGGSISVSNGSVHGARFTVKLPVRIAPDGHSPTIEHTDTTWSTTISPYSTPSPTFDTPAPDMPPAIASKSDKLILLVDDKQDLRDSVKVLLEHFGFRCDSAASGSEALEKATSTRFAAILLDIQMPDMDGFTVAMRLRSGDGPNRDIPIIAMSGFPEMFSTAEQRDVFTEYLTKPVGHENLIPLLNELT